MLVERRITGAGGACPLMRSTSRCVRVCHIEAGLSTASGSTGGTGGRKRCARSGRSTTRQSTGASCKPNCRRLSGVRISSRGSPSSVRRHVSGLPMGRNFSRLPTYLQANACRFETNDAGSEVESLLVRTLSGSSFKVNAKVFVVAAGGIENARLLLASGTTEGQGVGDGRDLIGRFL